MSDGTKKTTTPGPMIYGNGLEHILDIVYDNKDVDSCLQVLPYNSCEIVLGVCQKHIKIEGDNQKGFDFVARDDEGEEILHRHTEYAERDFRESCKMISDLSKDDCTAKKRRWAREWLESIGYEE